jgi:hypothetical protein
LKLDEKGFSCMLNAVGIRQFRIEDNVGVKCPYAKRRGIN